MSAGRDGDRPSAHGKILGRALALIAELGRRDAPMPIPDPCATCAFREGTAPNMTAGTGKIALDCTLGIDDDRFACHHGMKDGEPQRICLGYAAALFAPYSSVKVVVEACHKDLADIADDKLDQVRAEFDRWAAVADPDRKMDVYQLARAYQRHLADVREAAE